MARLFLLTFNMTLRPFLSSAGWSLSELVVKGLQFHEVPRVSVSDRNLDAIIRKHETSGVPLVIEGMSEHRAWPSDMFDIQWLRTNLKHRELGNAFSWSCCDILARYTGQECT